MCWRSCWQGAKAWMDEGGSHAVRGLMEGTFWCAAFTFPALFAVLVLAIKTFVTSPGRRGGPIWLRWSHACYFRVMGDRVLERLSSGPSPQPSPRRYFWVGSRYFMGGERESRVEGPGFAGHELMENAPALSSRTGGLEPHANHPASTLEISNFWDARASFSRVFDHGLHGYLRLRVTFFAVVFAHALRSYQSRIAVQHAPAA